MLVALCKVDWPGMKQYITSKIEAQQNEQEFKF